MAEGPAFLIREHMPVNEQPAQCAAKTITVKGKLAGSDGINPIEKFEVVQ